MNLLLYDGTATEERRRADRDFAVQLARAQADEGGLFLLELPNVTSWLPERQPTGWEELVDYPSVSVQAVGDGQAGRGHLLVTNSAWLAGAGRGASVAEEEDELTPTLPKVGRRVTLFNQKARQLRDAGDFSRSTCSFLATESVEVARGRTRRSSRESPAKSSLLYGMLEGGGAPMLSRITLEQPEFVRYINDYLDYHRTDQGLRDFFVVEKSARDVGHPYGAVRPRPSCWSQYLQPHALLRIRQVQRC